MIIEEESTKVLIPVTKVKQKIHVSKTNKTYYRVMFPLMLSWVSTIHRGQGFTVDILHSYIDSSIFADGQAYTTLPRVRKLENLHLKHLDVSAFKTSSTVTEIMKHASEHNSLKTIPIPIKEYKNSNSKIISETTVQNDKFTNIKIESNPSKPESINNTSQICDTETQSSASSEINEINTKLTNLGKNIFLLKYFIPPTDIQKISTLCTVHKPTFQLMLFYQNFPTSLFDKNKDIIEVSHIFPNSFLSHYVPVKTPPDGNCLFHAVSISLTGNIHITRHLKLFTTYIMVTNKDIFLSIIQFDNAHIRNKMTIPQYLEHIIYIARKWGQWGNEYHLLALSAGLQRDIYCYVPFRLSELTSDEQNDIKHLKLLFDNHKLSNQLLYHCPRDLQKTNYNKDDPICIFYYGHNHYTSIKHLSS